MSYYVAFDLGAESGRAIKGALRKGKLTIEEAHRFPNTPVPVHGTIHWDVLGLLKNVREGLRLCAAQAGEAPAGIGVDTWGVDFGLLDKNGALLANPVHYRDKRTEGMIELACSIVGREKIYSITGTAFQPADGRPQLRAVVQVERVDRDKRTEGMIELACSIVGREKIYSITGTAFQPFNTLYQLLALHRSNPPWFHDAHTALLMPDLIHYFLCGRKSAEYTIASTTQLLDARTRNWSDELCKALSLRRELLPPVVESGTVLGALTEESQRECNVGPVPVIAPAAHDTGSAFAAVPARSKEWVTLSCGTWSIMGIEIPAPRTDKATLERNFANEGAVEGKIRLLKNIMGLWVLQECRRCWARAGKEMSYAELTQEAAAAKPFPCILNIDDPSFYAPKDMLEAIAAFCKRTGQKMPKERAQIVRAIIEGVALRYRAVLGELEEMLGKNMGVVHMVGGGIQNKLLCQMAADAMNRPVVAGPTEATAIGNIIMQAVATKELASMTEARDLVRASVEITDYKPEDTAAWEDAFARHNKIVAGR